MAVGATERTERRSASVVEERKRGADGVPNAKRWGLNRREAAAPSAK
jgi:hypothetical protein